MSTTVSAKVPEDLRRDGNESVDADEIAELVRADRTERNR